MEILGVAISPTCVAAGAVPDIEALLLHGQLLLSQGSYVLARESLRRAVAISPLSPVALASLAMAMIAVRRSTEGGTRGGSSSGDVVGGSGGPNNHTISHLLHGRDDGEDDDENDMASSLSAGIQVSSDMCTSSYYLTPYPILPLCHPYLSTLLSFLPYPSSVGGICDQIVLSGE